MHKILVLIALIVLNRCVTPDLDKAEQEDALAKNQTFRNQIKRDLGHKQLRAYTTKMRQFMVWKVEKNNKTSYLLGTIHTGVQWSEFPLKLTEQLLSANQLVIERNINSSDIDNMNSRALFESDDSSNLKDLTKELSREEWKIFAKGVFPKDATLFKFEDPIVLKNIYINDRVIQFGNFGGFLDMEILAEAKAKGKKILYLETGREAYSALRNTNLAEKNRKKYSLPDLKNFLNHNPDQEVEESISKLYDLILAYRQCDMNAVNKIDASDHYDRLIKDRNLLWMPVLVPILENNSTLVAVGVGHMAGDAGLITLLEAKGFKVTRLSNAN